MGNGISGPRKGSDATQPTNSAIQPCADAPPVADRRSLGEDPATGQYRKGEHDTALRVEEARGIRLERYDPAVHGGGKGDWYDPKTGEVYDGCSPAPAAYFDSQLANYENSLRAHLEHANLNYVVIDTTGLNLTAEQEATLAQVITNIAGDNRRKIVRLP